MKNGIQWAGLALLLMLLLYGCGDGNGMKAPNFSLHDLQGRETSLEEHRGRVVLLDFWATWCPPCRGSIPELVSLQKKYNDKGLVVLGISLDDPRTTTDHYLRAFNQKFRINYAVLRFDRGIIKDYFKEETPSIPTMFIIDREGEIRDRIVGFRPGTIEASLTKIL